MVISKKVITNFIISTLIVSFPVFPATITYDYDTTDFANPERGFFWQTNPDYNQFLQARNQSHTTLFRWPIVMDQFRNGPLSAAFLAQTDSGFAAARRAGSKIIARFAYNYDASGLDAPLDTVLKHIDQLKPVLARNYDVIAMLEAGFIGAWGEWHTSSNNIATPAGRKAILLKLLSALPKERMVVVRTPGYKQEVFATTTPLDSANGFSGTDIARTGQHNDCLGASIEDWGTYPTNAIEAMKNYLSLDNRYVPMEGETCNPSSYSTCATMPAEMARMRWDALNLNYHQDVIASWKTDGCFGDISRRLGYRFALVNAVIQDSARAGSRFRADLRITNTGWGKCYNPRGLELVLRETTSKKKTFFKLGADPRRWLTPDTATVSLDTMLPASLPDGDYALYLNLPDTISALYSRPAYSIRLANKGVWEDSTGYNSLRHTLYVRATAPVLSRPATMQAYLAQQAREPGKVYDIRGRLIGKTTSSDLIRRNGKMTGHGVYLLEKSRDRKRVVVE
jgi:hypothetical protein